MKPSIHPWRDVGLPIIVSMGLFCVLNHCWNAPFPHSKLYRLVPAHLDVYLVSSFVQQVGVYLVSSLVALSFLAKSVGGGLLSARDVGLGPDGWRAWRRLLGGGLTIALAAFLWVTLEAKHPPSFGDLCFWFFFLLPASMTELLVFVCLGFCLPERWLRERRWRPPWALLAAGLFCSVSFGLYHYTHEEQWHPFAVPLMLVMGLINLPCFVLTRNFHLTLAVHNVVAAVGFMQTQYSQSPPPADMNPATYYTPLMITVLILTFAVPYVLWHVLEWRYWPHESQPA